MRKIIFFAFLMIFTLTAAIASTGKNDLKSSSDNGAVLTKTENKLSAEELTRLTNRVEEIRSMDKSAMTVTEKRELRKELKGIKSNVRRGGEVIYISGGTILLIILILLLI
jgi:hypothetical protein